MALWFSHPAVFTLAAIGIAVLAEGESRSTDECRRRCLYLFGTWLAAFLLVFGPLYLAGGPSARLHTYWRTAFAPGWPSTWEELRWYPNSLLNYMQVAFGPARRYGIGAMDQEFHLAGTGFLILTTAGWFALRSVWPRMALVSALTLTCALIGALLAVNPFRGRLLIYLLPIAFLNVGAYFHAWRRWWGIPTLLGAALIAVVLGGEVVRGWYQPFHSPQARLVMECIGRSQRSTDVYYLLPRTGSAFGFYRRRIDVHRRQMRNLRVNGEKKKEGPRFTEHLAQIVAASKTRVWLVGLHKPAPYFDQLRSTPLEKHRIVACKAHGADAWLLSAALNS